MNATKRLLACAVALCLLLSPMTAYADHVYGNDSDSYREYDELDAQYDNIDYIKNSGITRMNVGDTVDMAAEMIFDYPGGRFTWSSSRPEIASVSSTGKVTAEAEGTCYVTATYPDNRGNTRRNTMRIKVGTGPASVDTPAAYSLVMTPGEFLMIRELVFPGFTGTVRWSSSDGKVASVNKGKLAADSYGSCTITGVRSDAGGAEIRREVSVRVVSQKSTVDRPYVISLAKGDSVDLRAALHPYFTQESVYGKVRCSTSDAGVVSIDGCTAKAAGMGACTVTVRHEDPVKGYETVVKIAVKVVE